ncbi:MAG: AAA family ATPase [Alteromonadaceae bacterium]|nr:MAG: AAA family ATPase [Alteromonadaceae bacterium]
MKYPIGIQTFSEIIEEGYVYIDKTADIHQLISQGKWYFLSRPRRFGKSLLISTLEAIFQGRKALFEGLDIADTDYAFDAHPVVKLEFTKAEITNAESLRSFISEQAVSLAAVHQITLTATRYERQFDELITLLHQKTGKKVVLLIDEYDKPILNTLETGELAEVKNTTNAFYAVVKALDEHLRFVFVTGVSKFSKVSAFPEADSSGMNNLNDISMNQESATLCGYTQAELEHYLSAGLSDIAEAESQSIDVIKAKTKQWYNGYCLHPKGETVYNPHSILSLLRHQEFNNFWFQSATPTFLIHLLKRDQTDLSELERMEVGAAAFYAVEPEDLDVYAVLLQTGYLTIKHYDAPSYFLDFPNQEIKDSFFHSLAANYAGVRPSLTNIYAAKMHKALNKGDVSTFVDQLRIFLANVPYDITLKNEKYYQSLFFVICKLLAFTAEVEVSTNKGRIDCVIQTDNAIYVIEFKLQGTKEAALQQIKDKQYAQKYLGQNKRVVLLGVEFDHEQSNIGEWVEESIKIKP